MKKIIYAFAIALIAIACKNEPKNYVELSGKITNQNSDSLLVVNPQIKFKKVIKVNKDGSFKDTLKVTDGDFFLFDGTKGTSVYLKNGYNLNVTLDAADFDSSLKFTGKGSEENNFLVEALKLNKQSFDPSILDLDEKAFNEKLDNFDTKLNGLLDNTKGLDSAFIATQKLNFERSKSSIKNFYNQRKESLKGLEKGSPSPKFVDYENYAGGTMSLDDLKGKYVYIDLWATWCGPCKKEIPFLKEVEKAYHDKNIAFVSISIDSPKAYQKWKDMVKDKELGGIQLYAKGDQKFTDAYKVRGIPRFILLDTEGNIINADAPRPSNPKLKEVFNNLSI